MKQQKLAVVIMVFYTLISTAQTSFLHFNASEIDTLTTSFYGDGLTKFKASNYQNDSLLINYNPAVPFNGVDDYLVIDKDLTSLKQLTIFTVFKPNVDIAEREVWGFQGEESYVGLTTDRAFNNDRQTFYEKDSLGNPLLHTYYQLHSPKSGNSNTSSYVSLGVYKQDSTFNNNYFNGGIAEVIAYKRRVRGTNKQKIESALALKYGITLANGEDYISSSKEVIWATEDDGKYSNNIFGIGRDEEYEVYQKQSTSANNPEFMVLSATQKAVSNAENTSTFQDGNFIVIGDDKGSLGISKTEDLKTIGRTWLVKATGNQTKNIGTELQVDASQFFDQLYELEDYLLVINEDEEGDFKEDNIYVKPSALSATGILTFEDLNWDEDGSDKDIFTFLIKDPIEVSLESENPEVCDGVFTTMEYEAEGGIPPYSYSLQHNGIEVKTWTSDDDEGMDYSLEDIDAGTYTLVVKDEIGDTAQTDYFIGKLDGITVDLGEDQTLEFEQSLTLSPNITEGAVIESYEWTSDNGFYSTDEKVEISEAGIYTLTVSNALGCTYSDEIVINESFIKKFTLYPNPTTDGNYSIDVELSEKGSIDVSVYNSLGVLLNNYSFNNKSETTIKGKVIKVTGLYEILLVTEKGTATKKLIVK